MLYLTNNSRITILWKFAKQPPPQPPNRTDNNRISAPTTNSEYTVWLYAAHSQSEALIIPSNVLFLHTDNDDRNKKTIATFFEQDVQHHSLPIQLCHSYRIIIEHFQIYLANLTPKPWTACPIHTTSSMLLSTDTYVRLCDTFRKLFRNSLDCHRANRN